MFSFSTLLRCFLILAFCLDGSASLWSASSMAVSMAGHGGGSGHGQRQRMHDERAPAAAMDVDCPDGELAGRVDTGHEIDHESCDCSSAACECPAGFTNVVAVHGVPFAAQHRVSTALTVPEPASIARGSLSPVFRPPIG